VLVHRERHRRSADFSLGVRAAGPNQVRVDQPDARRRRAFHLQVIC
jgi:hypothetical protein